MVPELLAAVESSTAAWSLCDRWPAERIAFTFVDARMRRVDLTYGELAARSRSLAAGLRARGVGPGDRVATLLGRSPDLVCLMLAIWRLGAVQVPLFTAFGPDAVAERTAGVAVLVTEAAHRHRVPADPGWAVAEVADLHGAGADDPVLADVLVELFTSGTTGQPKAVPVRRRALAAFAVYQRYGLDHRDDDVFWNAADPAWGYGLYQAVLGPLLLGHRALVLTSAFTPETAWRLLADVTNFAAAPTAYRSLRAAAGERRVSLRAASSAGEPLPDDVAEWTLAALGVRARDHFGQSELGMVAADAWHPDLLDEHGGGTIGAALPGWTLSVLGTDHDEPVRVGERGRLAVDVARSPLMWFSGYRDAPARTAEKFSADGRWFLTGDVAQMDERGRIRFHGREDDVILMSGYRIGPVEVETALERHPAVRDSAVVALPDELRGEVVAAFVVVEPGTDASAALAEELRQFVKTNLSAHACPRVVRFVAELPRTASGKLQRSAVRASA